MEERKRNNFGVVRFVLAFVVVIAHFLELAQITDLRFLHPWAKSVLAVQLFFMLSGYFSISSFERSNTFSSFFRIYPAYFFVVCISFLFLSFASTLKLADYFSSLTAWKYLGANLIFANFLAPILPGVFESNFLPYTNGSLWTLKIEVAYFLIVPFVFFARKHIGKWPVSIVLISISLFYTFLIANLFSGSDVFIKQLPGQLHWFAFGIIAYDIRHKIMQMDTWLYIALLITLYFLHYWWTPLYFISVIALVFGVALKLPFFKFSDWLGNISYSVYLIHFPVIQLGVALGLIGNYRGLSLLSCLALIIIFSYLIYRFIERLLIIKGNRIKRNPIQ